MDCVVVSLETAILIGVCEGSPAILAKYLVMSSLATLRSLMRLTASLLTVGFVLALWQLASRVHLPVVAVRHGRAPGNNDCSRFLSTVRHRFTPNPAPGTPGERPIAAVARYKSVPRDDRSRLVSGCACRMSQSADHGRLILASPQQRLRLLRIRLRA